MMATSEPRRRSHKPGGVQPHLPSEPLVQLISGRGGIALVLDSAAQEDRVRFDRAYHRGKRVGWFTEATADEMSTRLLGLCPLEVWGDDWLTVA